MTLKNEALIFIGHGSREQSASEEFLSFVEKFKEKNSSSNVHHCFIELEAPLFIDKIFEVCSIPNINSIVLLPLFLFSSRHIKNDLPLIVEKIRRDFPHIEIRSCDTLKSHPVMIDIVMEKIRALSAEEDFRESVLLMVGRGASDPESNGEFHKITRLVEERANFRLGLASYVGITTPLLEESLNLISRIRPKRVIVVPYFLFHGRLIEKIHDEIKEFQTKYPWINVEVSEHVGADPRLVDLFISYVENIGNSNTELSCLNCQYRPEIKSVATEVKSLDALLWSVRHLYTHSKAPPHEFPHKKLKKHVLVCEGKECANRGSAGITTTLRQYIKENIEPGKMRVTKTSCMGRCGEGPVLAVYPDGVWYRNVATSDVADVFHQHLMKDEVVGRLVDDIMV